MPDIVFLIYDVSAGGGTERVTSVIINALAAQNHKIHLIGICGDPDNLFFALDKRVKVTSLHMERGGGLKKLPPAISQIRRYVKANRAGLFVTVESILSMYSVPALFGIGVKHIVWEHFNFKVTLGLAARTMGRQLASTFADKVITLTARDAGFWKQGSWFNRADIVHIPNPVFLEEKPVPDQVTKTVISVGRLTFQKGFDLLIDAWHGISKDLRQDWRLLIIGDGEDKDQLEAQVKRLDLSGSVQLIPATREVFRYFESASVYCLSSRFEGLPMVLIEALAFHLPIVAFDCDTGPEELIDNGLNGLLVEAGNVAKLSETLGKVMRDEQLLAQMRHHPSKKLQSLNLTSILQQWQKVIE